MHRLHLSENNYSVLCLSIIFGTIRAGFGIRDKCLDFGTFLNFSGRLVTLGRGGGGVRAIVTHPGPTTGGRTYDRRGCLKKEDKYASGRTPDRALKNRTVWPKAGRMAKIRGYSPECPGGLTTSMLTGNRWGRGRIYGKPFSHLLARLDMCCRYLQFSFA